MKSYTKCIKVAIKYDKNRNTLPEQELFEILRYFRYNSFLAYNRILTYLYTNKMQGMIQRDLGIKQNEKDLYGKSFQAWCENRMNEMIPGYLSNNIAQARQYVFSRYKNDEKLGLLKGRVSLSQFKLNCPLIIHNKAYKIIETPKGLGVELGLFNKEKQKELGIKRLIFNIPGVNNSEKAILRRLMNKTYKQGAIQLKENKRKNKWEIAISYTFSKNETEEPKDNIMGIDLGIIKVATFSIYNPLENEYLKINWKDRYIDGKELIHYRQKLEERRKSLGIASKWCSENRTGKGYDNRMKKANLASDKYSKFRDTYNHKISKYIIDIAKKYNVGCIQMEDLSGFSSSHSESLLKNWSYYDLQNKIRYKACESNISVILINPSYTSLRCSVCGYINRLNRDCKTNQAKFECQLCKYSDNADINASKNIALPNIEKLIESTQKE